MTKLETYAKEIDEAKSISDLENLTEKMAYDETLTNEQYCNLVSMALRCVDAGIMKFNEKEKHWDGSFSEASLPYLGW